MNQNLTAATVCQGILYAVDAMFFGGWYFAATHQAIDHVWALNW